MNEKLQSALHDALEIEYQWTDSWDKDTYDYQFSSAYRNNLQEIAKKAGYQYISIGRRQLRKALVAVLVALLALAVTGCAIVIHHEIVKWNEKNNFIQGTMDITFDVDDPNRQLKDRGFVCPNTPEGYEIVDEIKNDGIWMIEYSDGDSQIIYCQDSGIENVSMSIDNENNNLTETQINGVKGYRGYEKEFNLSSFHWCDGMYMYDLSGNCDVEILERMIEEIGE